MEQERHQCVILGVTENTACQAQILLRANNQAKP
jgi:hypothetical protein